MARLSVLLVILLIPGAASGQAIERTTEVCHGLIARADALPTGSASGDVRVGAPSAAERFMGRFYASAINTKRIDALGIASLQADLDRVNSLQSSVEIAAFLGELHAAGRFILFRPGVTTDYRNSHIDVLQVSPGGLGLPRESYYLRNDAFSVVVREKYREHVSVMLALANIFSNPGLDRVVPDPDSQADRILAIESRLAAGWIGPNDHQLVNDVGAAATTPTIDWVAYSAGLGVGAVVEFLFPDGTFFAEVETMLNELSLSDWKAYMKWHLIRTAAPYLTAPFADEHAAFYRGFLGGNGQEQPRWIHAQSVVSALAGPAVRAIEDGFVPFTVTSDDYLGNVLRGRAFAAQQMFGRVGVPSPADEPACRKAD